MIYECTCGRLAKTRVCSDCRRTPPPPPSEISLRKREHDVLADDYSDESDPDSIPYEHSNCTRLPVDSYGGEKRHNGKRIR